MNPEQIAEYACKDCGVPVATGSHGQKCFAGQVDDPQHRLTCDWNLYPEQRPDPELCNLDCLDDPEGVAASRAYVDAHSDGSASEELRDGGL